jgi:hypothetical protein
MVEKAGRATRMLLDTVRALLRPVVRQLIAQGVTYPAFSQLVKEVYIDVATRHFTLDFKPQTDSRVALVTGITRKEIGRLRRGQGAVPISKRGGEPPLPARVVARWRGGPPYTNPTGTPYELPYESARSVDFVALVAELGGDIPPRAVLDELLRRGEVRLTPRGNVRLLAAAPAAAADAGEAAADEVVAAVQRYFGRL